MHSKENLFSGRLTRIEAGPPAVGDASPGQLARRFADVESEKGLPRRYVRCRVLVVIFSMLGTATIYLQRVCMSIVAEDASKKDGKPTMVSEFGWSSTQQGILFGAFFAGYCLFQIPAAWFCRTIGAGRVFSLGIVLSSIFTLLTPLAATESFYLVVLCRVLAGMSQGPEYPAASQLVTYWAPPLERARMISSLCSGSYLGTFLCYPLSSLLLQCFGWRVILYTFGSFGIVLGAFYALVIYDSPQVHPRINPIERSFILYSQRGSMSDLAQPPEAEPLGEVMKQALCSRAIWALIIGSFCNNFGFYVLVSELPTFMHKVVHLSQETSGLMAFVPYLCLWLVTVGSGVFADWLVKRGVKLVKARRLCFAIAEVPPACLLVVAGYAPGSSALIFLFLAIGCNGFFNCAISANAIDVGGQHVGVIYGIANTAGSIPAVVAEPIFGIVTDRLGYTEGFRSSFWICCGLYLIGASVFGLASSSRPFLTCRIRT